MCKYIGRSQIFVITSYRYFVIPSFRYTVISLFRNLVITSSNKKKQKSECETHPDFCFIIFSLGRDCLLKQHFLSVHDIDSASWVGYLTSLQVVDFYFAIRQWTVDVFDTCRLVEYFDEDVVTTDEWFRISLAVFLANHLDV